MYINISDLFVLKENDPTFIVDNRIVFWYEFKKQVASYANFIKTIEDDKIALYIDDTYTFAVCFFAVLNTGKELLLPQNLKEPSLHSICCETSTLISDAKITASGLQVIDPHKINSSPVFEFKKLDSNSLLINFFTSGSTSNSKKITKTLKMLEASASAHAARYKDSFTGDSVLLSSVQPYHVYGMFLRFLVPISCGVLIDSSIILFPEELVEKMKMHKSVLFASVPSFLSRLCAHGSLYDFPSNCAAIFSSGSLLDHESSMAVDRTFGVSPLEIYGSTESGVIAWRQQRNGTNWTLFDTVQITERDGSITVNSDFSYIDDFALQDDVTLISDHEFILHGRKDRLVKIAEKRVSLSSMEEIISKNDFVQKCSCVFLDDIKTLGAVVVLSKDGIGFVKQKSKRELIHKICDDLGNYFEKTVMPKRWRFVCDFPFTENGKVLSSALKNILLSKIDEPIVEDILRKEDGVELTCNFLSSAKYFDGHFPEVKILPGVAQVHFAVHFFKIFFRQKISIDKIQRLKFSKIISPNQDVKLILQRCANGFSFKYATINSEVCSSGTVVFRDE